MWPSPASADFVGKQGKIRDLLKLEEEKAACLASEALCEAVLHEMEGNHEARTKKKGEKADPSLPDP